MCVCVCGWVCEKSGCQNTEYLMNVLVYPLFHIFFHILSDLPNLLFLHIYIYIYIYLTCEMKIITIYMAMQLVIYIYIKCIIKYILMYICIHEYINVFMYLRI